MACLGHGQLTNRQVAQALRITVRHVQRLMPRHTFPTERHCACPWVEVDRRVRYARSPSPVKEGGTPPRDPAED